MKAYLAVLIVLALQISPLRAADRKEAPKPLPPEIVKAWRGIGANVGWMKMDLNDNRPIFQVEGKSRAMTVFQFTEWKQGALAKMTDPGVSFGVGLTRTEMTDEGLRELAGLKSIGALYLAATQVTDAGLKEVAGFKGLQTLDVRGTKVTDAGLKELAGLKSLERLYLNHCDVTGAGLKDLIGLENLQILNIGGTPVTDAGLKEAVGLKSLKSLIMWGTKATPAAIAELRKELPKCSVDDQ